MIYEGYENILIHRKAFALHLLIPHMFTQNWKEGCVNALTVIIVLSRKETVLGVSYRNAALQRGISSRVANLLCCPY